MEESKRWIVTYTKHIRQKRKVYQDGVLELHCPSNKVLLYDDSGKLLDSRFLKKDDLIECGVTLAFETHLVDIGDLDETHKPLQDLKVIGSDRKSHKKAGIYGQNSTNLFLVKKEKSRPDWHGSLNLHPHDTQATKREWDVLYTTQITQKAKRYHDGILKVISCGSHMNQLILLKEDGTTLSSRFQKSAEYLSIGNTYEMPNYLVEICKQRDVHEENLKPGLQNGGKPQNHASSETTTITGLEKSKNNPPDEPAVIRSSGTSRFTKGDEGLKNKPFREAFQILSILRRPPQESLVTGNLPAGQHSSQSLELFHLDPRGNGVASLKSVTAAEIPPDVTKLVSPDCKVEMPTDNCSTSSSLLRGEEECKASLPNLGVESALEDFLDLGTSSIVPDVSDTENGSSGRICIEELVGSHSEAKPKLGCTGLNSNRLQTEEQGNNEMCNQLYTHDSNPEGHGHSSAASSLGHLTAYPNANTNDTASKAFPEQATDADDFPSFNLGIEL